jgi:hypothetical protein
MNKLSKCMIYLSVCIAPVTAYAQEAPLEKCQSLQEQIERYNQLRRTGGSGSEMARWKRQRRESEASFRRLSCREYGRELRN